MFSLFFLLQPEHDEALWSAGHAGVHSHTATQEHAHEPGHEPAHEPAQEPPQQQAQDPAQEQEAQLDQLVQAMRKELTFSNVTLKGLYEARDAQIVHDSFAAVPKYTDYVLTFTPTSPQREFFLMYVPNGMAAFKFVNERGNKSIQQERAEEFQRRLQSVNPIRFGLGPRFLALKPLRRLTYREQQEIWEFHLMEAPMTCASLHKLNGDAKGEDDYAFQRFHDEFDFVSDNFFTVPFRNVVADSNAFVPKVWITVHTKDIAVNKELYQVCTIFRPLKEKRVLYEYYETDVSDAY